MESAGIEGGILFLLLELRFLESLKFSCLIPLAEKLDEPSGLEVLSDLGVLDPLTSLKFC